MSVSIMEDEDDSDGEPCADEAEDSEEAVPVLVLDPSVLAEVEEVEEGEVEEGEDDEPDDDDRQCAGAGVATAFFFRW